MGREEGREGGREAREGGERERGRGEREKEGEERENGMFINMYMNGMCIQHTHTRTHTTSKFVHKWSALCHSSSTYQLCHKLTQQLHTYNII